MSSLTNNTLRLNYKQLHEMLLKLGYSAHKADGGQMVYRHTRQDSLVAVKPARLNAIVPEVVVASVISNVINTKVAGEKKIRKLIPTAA